MPGEGAGCMAVGRRAVACIRARGVAERTGCDRRGRASGGAGREAGGGAEALWVDNNSREGFRAVETGLRVCVEG